MIGRIQGVLIEKQPPELLVDVQGIGYEIQAPMTTFYRLPDLNAEVVLHTHFVVREDAQLLYGFYDKRERGLFRALIKVNGVGPKMALAILSGIEAEQFVRCVHNGDALALVKIPGVGKKTAERLIIEMRDKLDALPIAPSLDSSASHPGQLLAAAHSDQQQVRVDAESALLALGYRAQEASKAVKSIDIAGLKSEDVIRLALKGMV